MSIVHIIDDDEAVLDALTLLLETEHLPVRGYRSAEMFLDQWPWPPGCIVTDMHLDGLSGLDLLQRLPPGPGAAPTILITGRSGLALADDARRLGAFALIEKPFSPETIIDAVRSALAASGAERP